MVKHNEGRRLIGAVRQSSTNSMPDLTSERYKVKRGPFASITEGHVQFFKKILDNNKVITDADECYSYNVDWVKMVRGKLCSILDVYHFFLQYLIFYAN